MHQKLLLILGISCCFIICDCVKRCSEDEYVVVRKNGRIRCKPCKCEGGGIGFDTNVKREVNENGYTTCYPCTKCPDGYYRSIDDVHSSCNLCVLDCNRAKRYDSVPCGGDTGGHCGDCFPGLTSDSSESNSVCGTNLENVRSPIVQETSSAANGVGTSDEKTYQVVSPEKTTLNPKSENSFRYETMIITVVVVCGLLFVSFFIFIFKLWKGSCSSHVASSGRGDYLSVATGQSSNKLLSDSQQTTQSKGAIDAPVLSSEREKPTIIDIDDFESDVENNENRETKKPLIDDHSNNVRIGKEMDLTIDGHDIEKNQNQVEVDADGFVLNDKDSIDDETERKVLNREQVQEQVRGELPSTPSVTDDCALMPSSKVTNFPKKESCQPIKKETSYVYYNRVIHEDDHSITVASNNIYGERRYEFFETYLKLGKPTIVPFEELWSKNPDRNGFPLYILNCLKSWIKENGTNADLEWLLESLKKADFHDAAIKIVCLKENEVPTDCAENDTNIKIIEL